MIAPTCGPNAGLKGLHGIKVEVAHNGEGRWRARRHAPQPLFHSGTLARCPELRSNHRDVSVKVVVLIERATLSLRIQYAYFDHPAVPTFSNPFSGLVTHVSADYQPN